MLIYPTLHYQNGGVIIDGNGQTDVPGLLCAGEITGGIHGRNRLMGNALLDILAFGRRAGRQAARLAQAARHKSAAAAAWRHRTRLPLAAPAGTGRAGRQRASANALPRPGPACLHRPTGTRAQEK
jgi:succinate dehydrogenase / fumarate reductase flavoprotein subunit/L-aspartate oxidase